MAPASKNVNSPSNASQSTRDSQRDCNQTSWFSEDDAESSTTSTIVSSTVAKHSALEFYQHVMAMKVNGTNIDDVLSESFSDIEWCQFLPCSDGGQLMSIGSIPHLSNPCGTHCKPCGPFARGKCYNGEKCTYCHFYHTRKERMQSSIGSGGKKESSAQRRERRLRSTKNKDQGLQHEMPVCVGEQSAQVFGDPMVNDCTWSTIAHGEVYQDGPAPRLISPRLPSAKDPIAPLVSAPCEFASNGIELTPRVLATKYFRSGISTPPPEEVDLNYGIHPDHAPQLYLTTLIQLYWQ
eukprot:gnl/MRDRNA2_/MRDRNA2_86448_c0_seq1.p1 gnl/MRDRNA2_/MRDRNA2_86448_c0~~gnl/MRDRNA2_/MRDRNA2_86448_c0_seq1.p1  ORF type:complete len:325 (-),score=51.32 gnl/MRDRNA2_/MRDRNA2_86448_c0_seq1:403-1284(-)